MSQRKEVRAPVRNPKRVRGEFTEEEMEVVNIFKKGEHQTRATFTTKTYEYWAPFNYPNVTVELGREGSGAEFNMDGVELDVPPHGAITITEEEPIIGVTVMGSACVSPGYVILHAEPSVWKYPRTGVKMKVENLWGLHVLGTLWHKGVDEGFRHAGMSSAHFDIPESRKVTIMGGGATDVEAGPGPSQVTAGNTFSDAHYCVRVIRVTVKENK